MAKTHHSHHPQPSKSPLTKNPLTGALASMLIKTSDGDTALHSNVQKWIYNLLGTFEFMSLRAEQKQEKVNLIVNTVITETKEFQKTEKLTSLTLNTLAVAAEKVIEGLKGREDYQALKGVGAAFAKLAKESASPRLKSQYRKSSAAIADAQLDDKVAQLTTSALSAPELQKFKTDEDKAEFIAKAVIAGVSNPDSVADSLKTPDKHAASASFERVLSRPEFENSEHYGALVAVSSYIRDSKDLPSPRASGIFKS